jgi:hypothetical protein
MERRGFSVVSPIQSYLGCRAATKARHERFGLKQEDSMAYEYPDRPTNRPDPIIENGHKAPDRRKEDRSWIPLVMAAAGILAIAGIAAVTTHESQQQVETGNK